VAQHAKRQSRLPITGRSILSALVLALVLAPGAAGCGGCAVALYEGALTEQAGDLVVVPEGGGRAERVKWPSGFGVHKDGDTLVIADFFGSVKAREGDFVRLEGGELEDGLWGSCGTIEVRATPTT
jgi:hypothetical protein